MVDKWSEIYETGKAAQNNDCEVRQNKFQRNLFFIARLKKEFEFTDEDIIRVYRVVDMNAVMNDEEQVIWAMQFLDLFHGIDKWGLSDILTSILSKKACA